MQRAHRLALGALLACATGAALAAETQIAPQGQPPSTAQAASPQSNAGAAKGAGALSWSAPLQNKIAQCQGCHGIEGWRTAYPEVYHVPKLGGQHAAYIMQALREYKSGDRSHPSMQAIASSLSDDDIANLAAYYSRGGPQTTTASK